MTSGSTLDHTGRCSLKSTIGSKCTYCTRKFNGKTLFWAPPAARGVHASKILPVSQIYLRAYQGPASDCVAAATDIFNEWTQSSRLRSFGSICLSLAQETQVFPTELESTDSPNLYIDIKIHSTDATTVIVNLATNHTSCTWLMQWDSASLTSVSQPNQGTPTPLSVTFRIFLPYPK